MVQRVAAREVAGSDVLEARREAYGVGGGGAAGLSAAEAKDASSGRDDIALVRDGREDRVLVRDGREDRAAAWRRGEDDAWVVRLSWASQAARRMAMAGRAGRT